MADLLRTKIGQGLGKHPDITAEALARLHADLLQALVWAWYGPDELQGMIDEMGKIEF